MFFFCGDSHFVEPFLMYFFHGDLHFYNPKKRMLGRILHAISWLSVQLLFQNFMFAAQTTSKQ